MAYKKTSAKKPSAAAKIAEQLHQQLVDNVQQLVTSDGWAQLLQAMTVKNGTELSRFSFNNMMVILAQMPEATAVISFKAWLERGRQVKKGSTALRVYAPITVTDKDRDGTPKVGRDGQEKKYVSFRMIPEFDISQTEPLWQDPHQMIITPATTPTQVVKPLQGEAPELMWDQLLTQVQETGYSVEFGNTGRAMGMTDPETNTVTISNRASKAQAAKTLAHELGHILADHVNDLAAYSEHRGQMETVAESFAYMVSAYYGLDSGGYSAPYISTWAGKEPEDILKAVQKTGSLVLSLYRGYVTEVESSEAEKLALVTV